MLVYYLYDEFNSLLITFFLINNINFRISLKKTADKAFRCNIKMLLCRARSLCRNNKRASQKKNKRIFPLLSIDTCQLQRRQSSASFNQPAVAALYNESSLNICLMSALIDVNLTTGNVSVSTSFIDKRICRVSYSSLLKQWRDT